MTKKTNPKGVTFRPCQISHDAAYSQVHVYHDGSHVGSIDRFEGDGSWSANEELDKRYGKGFCEKLPLKEAKRTVKQAIRDAFDHAEQHPKGVTRVTFRPCQISHDGAYSQVHVYHDGSYVGSIDRLEGDGGSETHREASHPRCARPCGTASERRDARDVQTVPDQPRRCVLLDPRVPRRGLRRGYRQAGRQTRSSTSATGKGSAKSFH